jgi:hypothetical protein
LVQIVFLFSLLAFVGCLHEGAGLGPLLRQPRPDPDVRLAGTFLNGSEAGRIVVLAFLPPGAGPYDPSTAPLMTASGTIQRSMDSLITVSGTYDAEFGRLDLSGGGYRFASFGIRIGSTVVAGGQYSGPNGFGIFGCRFGSPRGIVAYCGEYRSERTPEGGRFNLLIDGTTVVGAAFSTGSSGRYIAFDGTVASSGRIRTIEIKGTALGSRLRGTGVLDTETGHVSGDWEVDDASPATTDRGTWSGAQCH